MDARGQLASQAKKLRQAADKEKMSKADIQKKHDNLKQEVKSSARRGMRSDTTQSVVFDLDRQVKMMQKEIDSLERQARDIDKQSRQF